MKKLILSTVLASIISISGCASIIHGSSQQVGISSNPSNATVLVDNKMMGVTPLMADLSRKDKHSVKLVLDGYKPYEVTLSRSVSGWVWGNIAFGGIIGLAVDGISGGLYKLTPKQLHGELRKETVTSADNDQLYLTIVLKPQPGWTKIGELKQKDT